MFPVRFALVLKLRYVMFLYPVLLNVMFCSVPIVPFIPVTIVPVFVSYCVPFTYTPKLLMLDELYLFSLFYVY